MVNEIYSSKPQMTLKCEHECVRVFEGQMNVTFLSSYDDVRDYTATRQMQNVGYSGTTLDTEKDKPKIDVRFTMAFAKKRRDHNAVLWLTFVTRCSVT